jgi:hypothetical protein
MPDLKKILFWRTLTAHLDLCKHNTEAPSAAPYDQSARIYHEIFSALYGLIKDADLENEYQAWKENTLAILSDESMPTEEEGENHAAD